MTQLSTKNILKFKSLLKTLEIELSKMEKSKLTEIKDNYDHMEKLVYRGSAKDHVSLLKDSKFLEKKERDYRFLKEHAKRNDDLSSFIERLQGVKKIAEDLTNALSSLSNESFFKEPYDEKDEHEVLKPFIKDNERAFIYQDESEIEFRYILEHLFETFNTIYKNSGDKQ